MPSPCAHPGKHAVTQDGRMWCGLCERWIALDPRIVQAIREYEAHRNEPAYFTSIEDLDRELEGK